MLFTFQWQHDSFESFLFGPRLISISPWENKNNKHSNFGSKVVDKIITEVQANKHLSRQCLGNLFADVINQISVGFRGQSPLRKFSGSKENLDWLNDNSQGKLCFTQFSTRIYRNILYCHVIKEYRCLKNAINQLERNEWLFLSAFQQGLQQKLSWFLS